MDIYSKTYYREALRGHHCENLCKDAKSACSDRAPNGSRIFVKIMEFCVIFLIALFVLSLVSFLSLRPTLKEVRGEAGLSWERFVKAARERNDLIPGLAESIRGVSPGQGKLAGKLFEERTILHRSNDPRQIVASIDEMDHQLSKIEKLAQSSTEINSYTPFNQSWKRVASASSDIKTKRILYNQTVRRYNDLMVPFPQSIFSSIFGFVPLQHYPVNNYSDDAGHS